MAESRSLGAAPKEEPESSSSDQSPNWDSAVGMEIEYAATPSWD